MGITVQAQDAANSSQQFRAPRPPQISQPHLQHPAQTSSQPPPIDQTPDPYRQDTAIIVSDPTASYSGRKPCYPIIIFMSFFIIGSAIFGTIWTVNYGVSEMGNAFTTSGYIVALGAFIAGPVFARHYPHCKCWDKPGKPHLQTA